MTDFALYFVALGNHHDLVVRIIDGDIDRDRRYSPVNLFCARSVAGFVDGGHFDSLMEFEWYISGRLGMRKAHKFLCTTYKKLHQSIVERGCKQHDAMKWLVNRINECDPSDVFDRESGKWLNEYNREIAKWIAGFHSSN
jgi:hypothetical protein